MLNCPKKNRTVYQDEFLILLKKFIAIHGIDIFNNERFKVHFFDYLNGEYKRTRAFYFTQ